MPATNIPVITVCSNVYLETDGFCPICGQTHATHAPRKAKSRKELDAIKAQWKIQASSRFGQATPAASERAMRQRELTEASA